MKLRQLKNLDLQNKSVFLRLDLNVPIKNGIITDDTRIVKALPTIKYILEHTNRLVVASHLGRPKGKVNKDLSLEPVAAKICELLGKEVLFYEDYVNEPFEPMFARLGKDQFIMLENLRFHPGETKNDPEFAASLIKGIDYYVNDAFGTVHRAHASTVGAAEAKDPEYRAAGFLIEKEVEMLSKLKNNPEGPFTVVIGGAKVSDKMGVMLNLLDHCNDMIIGGAMAYSFLSYQKIKVGSSRVEADKMDLVDTILRNAKSRKVNIHLPIDHVCASEFSADAKAQTINTVEIPDGLMGLDIGPKTLLQYSSVLRDSKTILWNGPMGVFEWEAFSKGTLGVAKEISENHGLTIVGGGDSVAAVNKAKLADKMTHVSTGGGASLEFIEGVTLPGLKVLQDKS